MRDGEKSRVPFGSPEEVNEVSWESALPGSSFGVKTGWETCPFVRSAAVIQYLRKLRL